MKIIIETVRSLKIDKDLKAYAMEKFGKFDNRVDESAVCIVTFSDELAPKDGVNKTVHLTLTLPNEKNPIHLEESTSDFFGSIDLIQEKLEREMIKYKEKTKIGERRTEIL